VYHPVCYHNTANAVCSVLIWDRDSIVRDACAFQPSRSLLSFTLIPSAPRGRSVGNHYSALEAWSASYRRNLSRPFIKVLGPPVWMKTINQTDCSNPVWVIDLSSAMPILSASKLPSASLSADYPFPDRPCDSRSSPRVEKANRDAMN
jgi:hypothetical protein